MSSSIKYCMTTAMTRAYIARWGPPSVSPAAAAFARAAVGRCGDLERERVKTLLWAAAGLGRQGPGLGWGAAPEVLLHPSVIERFAAYSPGLSPSARRTLRTNLRFIARRVVPQLRAPDAPLGRERAKPPYTPAEIAGFLALAGAQPTTGRVLPRSPGRRRAAPAAAGAGLIAGARPPPRRNVPYPLISRLAGGTGLPPLETSRLRSTWLADAAALIGLPAFMRAAGITCSQRLGDIIATLPPGDEAAAITLLGATARSAPVASPVPPS